MRRLKSRTHISKLVYSPDSRYLFSIGGKSTAASVWDLQAGKVMQKIYMPEYGGTPPEPVTDIAFCLPNKLILAPKQRGYPLKVWDWPIASNATPSSEFHSGAFRGKILSVLDHTYLLIINGVGTMTFWNTVTNQHYETTHTNWFPFYPTEISQDGTLIAWANVGNLEIYAFSNPTIFQIEAKPRTRIFDYEHHRESKFIRFHPKEKVIVASFFNTLVVDDILTADSIHKDIIHEGEAIDLAFTPDGSKLLLLTTEGILHIWNTSTYEEIATYDFGVKSAKCLAVSPDSLTCAIGGGFLEIVIVDLE